MTHYLSVLLAVTFLASNALAQDCSSPPPLRGLPSQAEPFTIGGEGHVAGSLKLFELGDVFLKVPSAGFMLWGENECGLWVRYVERSDGAYGEGMYEVIPKSASGNYVIRGTGDQSKPLITIKPPIGFLSQYWATINIDIPATPVADERPGDIGAYEE